MAEEKKEEEKEKLSLKVNEAMPAAAAPSPFATAPLATQPGPAATAPPSSPSKNSSSSSSSSESKIPIDDFLKLDLRVGEVIAAEKVEKSKKLMKMTVRIGEEVRSIVGGIALAYTPEQLVGKKFVFVANLAPAKLMGIESNGMILAATIPETGEPSLLMVDASVPSGAKVK